MPSYKVSEIDLIPKEWDAIFLSELFDFKNGLNKEKKFFGHGTPIINYMDVFCKSFINIDDIAGRVSVNSSELIAYGVQKGDVFFTRTSETVEEIGIASVMLDEPQNTVFSGFVLRARSKNMRLDDKFKAYCFAPAYFRKQIISQASYTTRALTNGRCLSETVLICPPLSEQITIVKALSDIDSLLATLDKIIAKKHNMKQATMEQLLSGMNRISNFKEDWEEKNLSDIAFISKGTQLPSDKIDTYGNFPHYNGGVDPSSFTFQSNAPADTIVISEGGNSCGFVQFIAKPFWCGGHCYTIVPKLVHNEFLYHALKGRQTSIMGLRVGSGLPNVQKTALGLFKLIIPSNYAEQTEIANILSDMDEELFKLEVRRNKTKELKQAMMQELLTGKTRLVNKELIDA